MRAPDLTLSPLLSNPPEPSYGLHREPLYTSNPKAYEAEWHQRPRVLLRSVKDGREFTWFRPLPGNNGKVCEYPNVEIVRYMTSQESDKWDLHAKEKCLAATKARQEAERAQLRFQVSLLAIATFALLSPELIGFNVIHSIIKLTTECIKSSAKLMTLTLNIEMFI